MDKYSDFGGRFCFHASRVSRLPKKTEVMPARQLETREYLKTKLKKTSADTLQMIYKWSHHDLLLLHYYLFF